MVVGVQSVLRPIFQLFYSFFRLCTDRIKDLVCGQLTSTLNTLFFFPWNSGVNGMTPSIHDCDSHVRRITKGKLEVLHASNRIVFPSRYRKVHVLDSLSKVPITAAHGCLLSLNAWKLSPTLRNFEMVSKPHSNGHDHRCP